MLEIKIKYHDKDMGKIEKVPVGDWIDLRCAEDVDLKPFEFRTLSLGISMKLPEGYEAQILPRSSTFRRWGILMVNGMGIIDKSYSGENDIWGFPALAIRPVSICKGERICQFRIMPKMPDVKFVEVDHMDDPDRGGFGSTGRK